MEHPGLDGATSLKMSIHSINSSKLNVYHEISSQLSQLNALDSNEIFSSLTFASIFHSDTCTMLCPEIRLLVSKTKLSWLKL